MQLLVLHMKQNIKSTGKLNNESRNPLAIARNNTLIPHKQMRNGKNSQSRGLMQNTQKHLS